MQRQFEQQNLRSCIGFTSKSIHVKEEAAINRQQQLLAIIGEGETAASSHQVSASSHRIKQNSSYQSSKTEVV